MLPPAFEMLPPPRPAAGPVQTLFRDAVSFVATQAGVAAPPHVIVKSIDDTKAPPGTLPPHVGGAAPIDARSAQVLLGDRWTTGALNGLERLRREPLERWSEKDRRSFLYDVKDVLHEASHIVHAKYDEAMVAEFRSWPPTPDTGPLGRKALEEGITELSALAALGPFLQARAGAMPAAADIEAVRRAGSYGQQHGVRRLLQMAGASSEAEVSQQAIRLADAVPLHERVPELARMIASAHGRATPEEHRQLERLIPFYAQGDWAAIELLERTYPFRASG